MPPRSRAKKEAAALAQKEASVFSHQKEASGARVERVDEVGEEEEAAGAADSQVHGPFKALLRQVNGCFKGLVRCCCQPGEWLF